MAGFGGGMGGMAPTGGLAGVQVEAQINLGAMPQILRRIVTMALKARPIQAVLAILCALGAAVASLLVPRIFGHAVDQVTHLLGAFAQLHATHAPAAQAAALTVKAEHALWISGAVVIAVTVIQGVLTGLSQFQAEWVSQKVAYQMRLSYFRQLQRLSFG